MPMYDYCCEDCGSFRLLRPMSESRNSQACPDCTASSERTLAVPFLATGGTKQQIQGEGFGKSGSPWRSMCGFGCTHLH